MRVSWSLAVFAFLVTGCAEKRPAALVDCPRESALARGAHDGASHHKDLSFLRSCSEGTRAEALSAYREGYSKARPKKKTAPTGPADDLEESGLETSAAPLFLTGPMREPSAVSWVCEVEADSRVFTGVGVTRGEALDSARATCGSHLQASACTKADCKQNL